MSWKTVELGTLVELITKGTTPTSIGHQFSESGINFIKIESIDLNGKFIPEKFAKINDNCNEALKRSQLKEGDILFSIAGALGRTAIVTKDILPANTNQALGIIRLKNSELISKEYLVRVLNSESILNQIGKMKGGVAQQNLSLTQLKEFQIPLPPLATQQKIVAKLDAIFAEIDKATAAAEDNAKNAEALYSSSVNSIFEEFSSDLIKLSTFSDIGYGYTAKSSVDFEGYQYLRITDIQNDYVDWLSVPKIDKKNGDAKKFLLKDGDIVFARTGATTGKSYLVRNPPSAVFASYLIRVDVKRNMIEPEFLRHFFKSKRYWDSINAGISGAAQGGFNASKLGDLAIPLLNLKDQSKVIARLDEIENYSNTLKTIQFNKLNELLTLKQSVLRHAFYGELVNE